MQYLESSRLLIRQFTLQDADFILQLVNTPDWLKYIGDKNVKCIKDAERYLLEGPLKAYANKDFGLFAVVLKKNSKSIGTCGLLKRKFLDYPDLGFAILPEYYRRGIIYEACIEVIDWAAKSEKVEVVQAFTQASNNRSINLLKKIGFESCGQIRREDSSYNLFQWNL